MDPRPQDQHIACHEAGHVVVPCLLLGRLPRSVTIERIGELEGHCDWSGIMPIRGALRGLPLDEILGWLAMRAAGEEALGLAGVKAEYRGGRGDRFDASDLLMAAVREDRGPETIISESQAEFETLASPYWTEGQRRARECLATPAGRRMVSALTEALLLQRTLSGTQLADLLDPLKVSGTVLGEGAHKWTS